MNALHDASNPERSLDSTRTGLTSSAISDGKISHIGESVEYALDPAKQWFVLRVIYGRAKVAKEILNRNSILYYQPMHRVVKKVEGRVKRRVCPFFPSLIFVYVEPARLDALIRDKAENTVLTYYYNHFAVNDIGYNPPLTVSYAVMDNFIRLTRIDDEHIRVVDPKACRYKRGDTVIITRGTFKGIVGKLARVSQEQRVVINIDGVGMIATAYIPTAFIEPYDEEDILAENP